MPHYINDSCTTEEANITGTQDIGFVDMADKDLHILPSSIARNAAVNASVTPNTDIDGDVRNVATADAGADEID